MNFSTAVRAPFISGVACTVLALGSLAGCAGDEPVSQPSRALYTQDAAAQGFIEGLRGNISSGQRPSSADVQRLKKIAASYPEDPTVENTVLSTLAAFRDWDGLSVYLENKAELTDELRMMLTRVYVRQASYAKALQASKVLADREPTNVEANSLAGRSHYLLGDNEEAALYYDRVWPSIISQGLLVDLANRAMIYFDEGRLEAASDLLESALLAHSESIALHNAFTRVLAAQGKMEEAELHSSKVAELQAALESQEHLSMLRAAQTLALNEAMTAGNFDECVRLVYQYLPGAPESYRQELYGYLGGLYEAADRGIEAPAAVEKARQHAASGGGK